MHLICFSHLRWNFVYQRPQHLISRFSKKYLTYYVEEHVFSADDDGYTRVHTTEGVIVITPHLKSQPRYSTDVNQRIQSILEDLFFTNQIQESIFWYYTPMAWAFSSQLKPTVVVYDCMDELSAFKFAPPELRDFERILLERADIVFTGGNSLYEAKRKVHANVHCFPSSIDRKHFQVSRYLADEPADQRNIASPRIGFCGVIDERFDIPLIAGVAEARPEWSFIMIGPVVKIDPGSLPTKKNIHYLGAKGYNDLPGYLSGWDIALIPFARNESTRFISPTKTPEYLAAGVPVISTSIADVIDPYGRLGLVRIADTPAQFIGCINDELAAKDRSAWLSNVDKFLSTISWDETWSKMFQLLKNIMIEKREEKIQTR